MNTTKDQILKELMEKQIPDFNFLYSEQALNEAPILLEELLKKEKEEFEESLKLPDSEINFDVLDKVDVLGYYFGLLEHYNSVYSTDKIRKIIEDFEPKYIEFGQEMTYSNRYYEMFKIAASKENTSEQVRILQKNIESFERR